MLCIKKLITITLTAAFFLISGMTVAHADLSDGLVAYYPFNGNANDESGNGNNGTVNGATLIADRNGNVNSAYGFDGNDKITIQNHSSLNPSEITVSLWVNFGQLSDTSFIICKGGDRTSGAYRFFLYSQSLVFAIGTYDDLNYTLSTPLLQTSRWYNIAGTYNGKTISLYLDGNLISSKDVGSITIGNNSPLYLSYNDVGCCPYYVKGQIDDIRIYNRALSDSRAVKF